MTRYRESGSAIDMTDVNLLEGFDWKQKLAETPYALDPTLSSDPTSLDPTKNWSVDPTYGKNDLFNDGFTGRFMIKFIF